MSKHFDDPRDADWKLGELAVLAVCAVGIVLALCCVVGCASLAPDPSHGKKGTRDHG